MSLVQEFRHPYRIDVDLNTIASAVPGKTYFACLVLWNVH